MTVFNIKRLFIFLTVLLTLNVGYLSTTTDLVRAEELTTEITNLEAEGVSSETTGIVSSEESKTESINLEKEEISSETTGSTNLEVDEVPLETTQVEDANPIVSQDESPQLPIKNDAGIIQYSVPNDGSGYTMKPGDIFTTSSTSSSGIVGHSGIAVSSYYILHIAGPGAQTERLTLSQWRTRYPRTWVSRVPNATVATQAANWAYRNYYSTTYSDVKNTSTFYAITSNTQTKSPTYCSKIVWQAYYYGTGSTPVIQSGHYQVIYPYSIRDGVYFYSNYKPYTIAQW